MNSMKLTVRILFVVLATKTCTLTVAQDLEQDSVASVRQADPPEHHAFLSDAEEQNANRVGPDGRLQRASSVPVSVRAAANPTLAPEGCTAPSITEFLDDGCDESCCPDWNNPCPCAYVQVGALLMQQVPRFARQPIVVDPNTNTTFLSTSNFNSNFNPGLQATVGISLCGGRAVEFDYFGLFGGNASAVAVKPDPNAFLIFPNNFVGNVFVDMDRTQVNYSSSVQSFALNFACCCGCCDECCYECCDACCCDDVRCRSFTWFAGFRYLNLSERLDITAQRTVGGAVEEGVYNMRTTNNLYGG